MTPEQVATRGRNNSSPAPPPRGILSFPVHTRPHGWWVSPTPPSKHPAHWPHWQADHVQRLLPPVLRSQISVAAATGSPAWPLPLQMANFLPKASRVSRFAIMASGRLASHSLPLPSECRAAALGLWAGGQTQAASRGGTPCPESLLPSQC